MELTQDQYERIEHLLPVQRGNVSIPNLQVLNAILYIAEQGCKWRGLPPRFGRWHTIYTRMNRWAKNGVLDRIFEHLQREQIVRVKLEVVSMDSTIVKVHPDGTGALKKRAAVHRQVQGWMDHQDSYGCRGCSNSHDLLALPWTSSRRTGRAQVARTPWAPAREPGGYVNRCVNDIRRRPSQPLIQWRFHPHTVHRGRRLRSTQGPSDA